MILRASCFSVQHIDDQDFNATLQYDQDRVKENFDTIKGAIKEIMEDMVPNWLRYAGENFDWWLNKNFDGSTPPSWHGLVNSLADYMNKYFNPEPNSYKWGVVLCGGCHVRDNRIGSEKGMNFLTNNFIVTKTRRRFLEKAQLSTFKFI